MNLSVEYSDRHEMVLIVLFVICFFVKYKLHGFYQQITLFSKDNWIYMNSKNIPQKDIVETHVTKWGL